MMTQLFQLKMEEAFGRGSVKANFCGQKVTEI